MELAFLLLAAISATLGYLLRRKVSMKLRRTLLVMGLGSFILAVATFGLIVRGHLPSIGGGVFALMPFGLTALVLPFAIVLRWGKS